jgi:Xaa-Pro aminopeptidase
MHSMKYDRIQSSLFIKNRSKLRDLLLPGSTVVLHSNDEMNRSGDQNFRFRQSSDMLYLTGIDQEKTILVMSPEHPEEKFREVLFIFRASPENVTWNGYRLSMEEASSISGIKNIYWLEDYDRVFAEIIYQCQNVYLNTPEVLKYRNEIDTRDTRMARKMKEAYPLHTWHRLAPLMTKLRMVKEPEEIELIKKAVSITRDGFLRVLGFVKPGVMEYEVEAEMTHEFLRLGATGHAYLPIIASGANANILHYIDNSRECKEGDLLLMDFAAEYANYVADLTRTIPVSGRFSPRQSKVYDANLHVIREAVKLMKPGLLMADYNREVGNLWEEQHIKLGLYSLNEARNHGGGSPLWSKYLVHGTSHCIGLDVHDVFDKNERFRPGMVFTCEPAIYLPDEGFGIRLENNILITAEGNTDLTSGIPIEREEIEQLMNS